MRTYLLLITVIFIVCVSYLNAEDKARILCEKLALQAPEKGFVSASLASRWEESLITGNGTIGALIRGNPGNDIIILSHERLFMPEYPPTKAPDLTKYLDEIKSLTLDGEGEKASMLAIKAGREAGIDDLIWTDPLIPACQLEVKSETKETVTEHARMVNYQTGEAIAAWKTETGIYHQSVFVSRNDDVAVFRLHSPDGAKLSFRFRLNQLPLEGYEDEFDIDALVSGVNINVNESQLTFTTTFKKQWQGSLKGYNVTARVYNRNGEVQTSDGWIQVENADEILILSSIRLFYELPVLPEPQDITVTPDYDDLLSAHKKIHSEMFNRFSFNLAGGDQRKYTAKEIRDTSDPGNLSSVLLEQLMQAARYELISSTGELPPTLQGIWGGTWRPAWSGDFTLNGNVPSAIACGLNCNFQEVTEAYINYMWSMVDDFKDNARDLYGAPGIFVPSRTSSSGKTYHYLEEYPHLFWYAGAAWTSQFFYDYWQFTGDRQFLEEKAIPFMLASAEFYKYILTEEENGRYIFLPSYSPEVGPVGHHPVAINATMDIAAVKQLLRNLTTLADMGRIEKDKVPEWNNIVENLPEYAIDEEGDLKEWIWPGFENNNAHRHASHLYPLFYEVDPDFENNPELIEAAKQAIENRLAYRRDRNGAEMAFGLVQKGLAAAHIKDTEHAYECVDWLCNSYWSPVFTSYHDPGEIFNADICGGLPAVVTEMVIQSSAEAILLLPALPEQWPAGEINGVLTRCGVEVDLKWQDGKPLQATLTGQRDTHFKIFYAGEEWPIEIKKGQETTWIFN